MRIGETNLALIRVPIVIVDTDGNPFSGFVPAPGELLVSYSGAAFVSAPGALVEVGGGAYYYQGTTADVAIEGFTLIRINRVNFRGFGWRSVDGASGVISLPFEIDDVDGAPATGRAPGPSEMHLSINGGAYGAVTGTFAEIGGGAYYYTHDVAFISGFVLLSIDGVTDTFKPAIAWASNSFGVAPAPFVVPNASASSSDLDAQQARFYGEDIWYDVATADPTTGAADYVVTAAGDWALTAGIETLRQSLLRRLITVPGEWQTAPEYGVGAQQWVKRPNTPAVIAELETRIRSQFLRDDRVESVSTVKVEPLDGADGIKITVFVVAAGRLRQDAPLPVQIAIQ